MALRIENNIVNDSSKSSVTAPVQQGQVRRVVPVGQVKETETDAEKPVEGYYIEKTAQTPEEDDDGLDTSVNPTARITVNPSIAIYKETSEITNAMEQTVNRAVSNTFQDSGGDGYFKAEDMIKNKQAYKCFDDIDFVKKFNVYGKTVYEGNSFSYTTDVLKIKRQENSVKTDLGLNYKSKSENTKAMLFSSFTKTNTKTLFTSTSSESSELPKDEIERNYKSFRLYGAAQQRFKNKDLGTLSAFHINDDTQEAKTSNVTASYFFNKYMAPYLSIVKPVTTKMEGNWNSDLFFMNGTDKGYDDTFARAYLADGTSVTFRIVTSSDTNKRLLFRIDINGDKKPNKQGRDIFQYNYYIISSNENYNGKFAPTDFMESRENLLKDGGGSGCGRNSSGAKCSTLIMKDGWRIADDYPW